MVGFKLGFCISKIPNEHMCLSFSRSAHGHQVKESAWKSSLAFHNTLHLGATASCLTSNNSTRPQHNMTCNFDCKTVATTEVD